MTYCFIQCHTTGFLLTKIKHHSERGNHQQAQQSRFNAKRPRRHEILAQYSERHPVQPDSSLFPIELLNLQSINELGLLPIHRQHLDTFEQSRHVLLSYNLPPSPSNATRRLMEFTVESSPASYRHYLLSSAAIAIHKVSFGFKTWLIFQSLQHKTYPYTDIHIVSKRDMSVSTNVLAQSSFIQMKARHSVSDTRLRTQRSLKSNDNHYRFASDT